MCPVRVVLVWNDFLFGAVLTTRDAWLLSAYLITPIRYVYADAGSAGRLVDWTATILRTVLHVVRKPEGRQGFTVNPRRWCIERTLAWLTGA